ncbi:MAG: hypothetical protein L6R42_007833 [Xanthoria sp. 1 TBL-2021]|nr:MAG: hypothetical protein L6R42_007833 [Xanthoria sp. 1 TBL-2021]
MPRNRSGYNASSNSGFLSSSSLTIFPAFLLGNNATNHSSEAETRRNRRNVDIAPKAKSASPPRSANVESKENEDPGVNPTNNTGSTKPAAEEKIADITATADAITTPSEDIREVRTTQDDSGDQ